MGWMWIFWILLIVGAVVLVIVLAKVFFGGAGRGVREGGSAPPPGAHPPRPRDILQERYARGEISTEEYTERLRTLDEDDR